MLHVRHAFTQTRASQNFQRLGLSAVLSCFQWLYNGYCAHTSAYPQNTSIMLNEHIGRYNHHAQLVHSLSQIDDFYNIYLYIYDMNSVRNSRHHYQPTSNTPHYPSHRNQMSEILSSLFKNFSAAQTISKSIQGRYKIPYIRNS